MTLLQNRVLFPYIAATGLFFIAAAVHAQEAVADPGVSVPAVSTPAAATVPVPAQPVSEDAASTTVASTEQAVSVTAAPAAAASATGISASPVPALTSPALADASSSVTEVAVPLPDVTLPMPRVPIAGAVPAPGQKANVAAAARGADELPEPKLKINAPRLQQASAVQVAAAPASSVSVTKAPAAQTPQKASSAASGVQSAPSPAPVAKVGSAATTQAKVSAAVSPSPRPSTVPLASPRPAASPAAAVAASPKPSVAPAVTAIATPRPVPGVTVARTVVDTTKQPEYSMVQAPVQSPPPGPLTSLPTGSQQLAGIAGQNVDMVLAGRGWIYMGTGKTPAGITLIEKSVTTDSEQFKFRMDTPGQLQLQFQRQDLRSGLVEKYNVSLAIAAKTGTASALAALNSLGSSNGDASLNGISTLINPGLNPDLTSTYVPQYSVPKDPLKQATSNGVSIVASPKPSAAPIAGSANTALSQTGAAQNTGSQSASQIQVAYIEPAVLPTDAAGLYKLGLARENAKRYDAAREAYENLVSVYPEYEKADDAMLRLAKLLEASTDNRNLRRAFDLYVKIQNEYPYSTLYSQAKDRARYLSRMFLKP